MSKGRIDVIDGPDSLGRYTYIVYISCGYFPGHPEGEYHSGERGQVFHTSLPDDLDEYEIIEKDRARREGETRSDWIERVRGYSR